MTELLYKVKRLEHIKLAIIFVALNMLDAVLTDIIIKTGGRELNPIMQYLFEQPKWMAWTFEVGGTLVAAFGLLLLAVYSPRFIKVVFITSIIIMGAVCLYNGIGLFSLS
ncbi:MAG: DUF5658 family protein [Dehalococcoidia bacterium]|nr:DUF5658 family protein [Dehalococcoidia bacterium]